MDSAISLGWDDINQHEHLLDAFQEAPPRRAALAAVPTRVPTAEPIRSRRPHKARHEPAAVDLGRLRDLSTFP